MDCREAIEHLEEFLGEKLGGAHASALEAHLDLCPGCAAEFRLHEEMKAAVKQTATRHTASPQLRASVRKREAGRVVPRWSKWWVPAAVFLLVLSIGTAAYLSLHAARPPAPAPLIVEAVNDYIRFTQRARSQEAGGLDVRQVIKRFQGKLDFALDLAVEGQNEFELVGGDLSYFLDRKVACLLYRKGPHVITLSVLRREGIEVPRGPSLNERGSPVHVAQHRGFTVIFWERNDLLHALVSDLDATELSRFADRVANF